MKRLAALLVILAVTAGPWTSASAQSESIRSYHSSIVVEANGSLAVTETIDYDFGSLQRHGIVRDIPMRFVYDDNFDRITPIDVVSVTGSPGTPVGYEVSGPDSAGVLEIKVGDPGQTITGEHTYTLSYTVRGALNGFPDHDEMYWNAVGSEWTVPVMNATAEVSAPANIVGAACYAGSSGSGLTCSGSRSQGKTASFAQDSLFPGEAFTVVVGFEKGAVPTPKPILVERWRFSRAFALTPFTGVTSGLLMAALLALFGILVWRNGRDRRYVGGAVAAAYGTPGGAEEAVPLLEHDPTPVEFLPPEGVRPGQVGTLIDEIANPLDVTATIVDLAVRGHLRIEEIPKEGRFGGTDWKLTKLKGPDDLLPFEEKLHHGLFEDGDTVKLSDLKTKFVARLREVQDGLYEDAVSRRWFSGRPDKVRNKWHAIGWAAIFVGASLLFVAARWTHLALLTVPSVIGGIVFAFGAHWMPRRTPQGTAMVRRVLGFRRFIESPTQEGMVKMAERENLFSEYLPYAIVFGLTDKWAKAFESLGREPRADWYVSPHPFAVAGFSQAISGFTTATAGTISSSPASSGSSGLGGGGFSGGGFGGGGGGSW